MTIPSPFTQNFPLKITPFGSRVESQLDSTKNYYFLAFKPGFPLQAAELNEMQEIFYLQQTLTQTMFANWGVDAYRRQGVIPMLATPWDGCTPLSPDLVVVEYDATTTTLTKGIFKAGWYLLKSSNFNSGLGVWVHNPTDVEFVSNYSLSSPSTMDGNYGIKVKLNVINCTKASPPGENEDITLQDSSNVNSINGPCGAARIQLKITGFGNTATSDEILLPIVSLTKIGGSIINLNFINLWNYNL